MTLIRNALLLVGICLYGTVSMAEDDATVPVQGESLDALRAVAESDGLVRVIVSVTTPDSVTEGTSLDGVKMMLQSALPMADAPLVDPIEDQPLVVMEVTARGLDFLSSSPMVARIQADGLTGIPPIETTPSPQDDTPSFGGGGGGSSDLAAPQN